MTGIVKVVVAVLVVIAALWYFTGNATGQAVLPETSPFVTACLAAEAAGQAEKVSVSSCRRVSEATVGNVSVVDISVRVTGFGRVPIRYYLSRSEWSVSAAVAGE